ncbi:helix-turn-helix domain-containing protein [Ochrobactrum soli]|nr:helix-turn-helix domain-containing protein [[Ochrobactrum] soli]
MKGLSNTACVSNVLGEIYDGAGQWHTGFLPYGQFAGLIGTTTADLMRRLVQLGIVEHTGERHRLTRMAVRKRFGMVIKKHRKGKPDLRFDVILPEGMVHVVTNLKATNLPETPIEKMNRSGMSQRDIASWLGKSQQSVSKHLRSLPPRLKNWPVVGTWDDCSEADNDNRSDNHSATAA